MADEKPIVIRLSVNLAPTVAEAFKSTAKRKGLSLTEAVRHMVALWKLVVDEQDKGNRIVVVSGEGDTATYRELVVM